MTNKKEERIPTKVNNYLKDRTEVSLTSKNLGSTYPCKPEPVTNGVIFWNSRETRVFKNTEVWEMIQGNHDKYHLK